MTSVACHLFDHRTFFMWQASCAIYTTTRYHRAVSLLSRLARPLRKCETPKFAAEEPVSGFGSVSLAFPYTNIYTRTHTHFAYVTPHHLGLVVRRLWAEVHAVGMAPHRFLANSQGRLVGCPHVGIRRDVDEVGGRLTGARSRMFHVRKGPTEAAREEGERMMNALVQTSVGRSKMTATTAMAGRATSDSSCRWSVRVCDSLNLSKQIHDLERNKHKDRRM